MDSTQRLQLHDFNNLTKTLGCSFFRLFWTDTADLRRRFIEQTNQYHNSGQLAELLTQVSDLIGADILNIARQDYEPQGASVTMMIAEGPVADSTGASTADADKSGARGESLVAHLNKSHLTVHTYPETHPEHPVSSLRIDMDIATCGNVSPLGAINFLLDTHDADLVLFDYRVRGITRDKAGDKVFIDEPVDAISDFIGGRRRAGYRTLDSNLRRHRLFHSRLLRRQRLCQRHLLPGDPAHRDGNAQQAIMAQIGQELDDIFAG